MKTTTSTKPKRFLPYGRQQIGPEDIASVEQTLHSDWLTQGPRIADFEEALARRVGADFAVACANGTAALHLSMLALGLGHDDAVITTPNTFLADANCARFVGADVLFADIDPNTGLIDPFAVEQHLHQDRDRRIKAVIPVDFAGQPCSLPQLHEIAERFDVAIVDDACHAIGADYEWGGDRIPLGGSPHADLSVFSFHPVKHVAMGEGGAVTTNNADLAERLRLLRNHGMQKDNFNNGDLAFAPDGAPNPWYYEMRELGYNYRVSDMQSALGLSQLNRLDWSLDERRRVAASYARKLQEQFDASMVRPLRLQGDVSHAYHLYVVLIDFEAFGCHRAAVMDGLRQRGIGTQVHYIPIHLQPYYRELYGHHYGDFPGTEAYYRRALSLPMIPDLSEEEIDYVVTSLSEVLRGDL